MGYVLFPPLVTCTMDKANFTSIVFGEILYDCFPDRTCLGGASLNFAWNLRQLGFPVAMISAVGQRRTRDSRRGAFSDAPTSISNGSLTGPSLRARSMYCSTMGNPPTPSAPA